ncbi:nuclear factor 7, ovary-like [Protopterus annectens]|uniref:nuclear factor 7, ovary-like n=1 Tax=Protopterus annectens TaxID=7888 RepID=UPI001CFAA058|nr:nuclear factor 7, ovary-like [Protopterus annectens]
MLRNESKTDDREMATSKTTAELVEELQCPVCGDMFKYPVTLECGHNLCKACIEGIWDSEKTPSCPTCTEQVPDRMFAANILLDITTEMAGNLSLSEKDKTSIPSPELYTVEMLKCVCKEHGEELKLFCKVDETPACVTCQDSSKHSSHIFLPMQEAVSMYQDKLKTVSASLELRVKELIELQSQQQQKMLGISHQARNLEKHITSEFATMIHFLQDREKMLIQQLKGDETEILQEMEENMMKLGEGISQIRRMISDIQAQAEQQDAVTFLTTIKDLMEKHKSVSADEQTTEENKSEESKVMEMKYRLSDRDLSLGMYSGPLQYSIWKEMKSILSPLPAPLHLDPKTACTFTVLSRDLSSMHFGDEETELTNNVERFNGIPAVMELTNNTERFDGIPAVLGSEGFTAGRYYWEVNVGDSTDWAIGVVQASVQRKWHEHDLPSPKNGLWLLMRREVLFVKDSKVHILELKLISKKVGIYLDYEEGQVSFYDADNMSHLHTYHDTFSERLYPFMLNCTETPLNIFHLQL